MPNEPKTRRYIVVVDMDPEGFGTQADYRASVQRLQDLRSHLAQRHVDATSAQWEMSGVWVVEGGPGLEGEAIYRAMRKVVFPKAPAVPYFMVCELKGAEFNGMTVRSMTGKVLMPDEDE